MTAITVPPFHQSGRNGADSSPEQDSHAGAKSSTSFRKMFGHHRNSERIAREDHLGIDNLHGHTSRKFNPLSIVDEHLWFQENRGHQFAPQLLFGVPSALSASAQPSKPRES